MHCIVSEFTSTLKKERVGKWESGRLGEVQKLVMARTLAPTNPPLYQTLPVWGGCS